MAVLDIGTAKIACFISHIDSAGEIKISGIGHQLSKGIKSGVITDFAEAEASIATAVHAAEQMAGANIEHVIVGVTLPEMRSRHIRVELALGNEAVKQTSAMEKQAVAFAALDDGHKKTHHILGDVTTRLDKIEIKLDKRMDT